jgi:proteasome lid subunit RPN8/RPN11
LEDYIKMTETLEANIVGNDEEYRENDPAYTLHEAVTQAIVQCKDTMEEAGGIIITKDGNFRFIKLSNRDTGTPKAGALYTVNRNEYAMIVLPWFKLGWKSYASFHTHPRWPAYPSITDYTYLFTGFPVNYIWSGVNKHVKRFAIDQVTGEWYETVEIN